MNQKKTFAVLLAVVAVFTAISVMICVYIKGKRDDEEEITLATAVQSGNGQIDTDMTAAQPTDSERVLLAQPLKDSGNEIPTGKPTAETLLYYAKGLSFSEANAQKANRTVSYLFNGQVNDADALKSYVDMLCDNGFRLVDSYYFEYEEAFSSWALDYIGNTLNGKSEMNYKDGVKGDITLYYSTERSSLKGGIFYSEEIELRDYGLRYGQGRKDMSYTGESAKAGLYRQGNSFETDDGRLKTELGKAAVLSDGSLYTADALVKRLAEKKITIFSTGTYNRTDGVGFVLPDYAIQSGEMYVNEQIDSEEACFRLMSNYQHADLMDALSVVDWQLAMGFGHGGSYICPCETIDTGIEKVFLRVLYSDGSVAVCYAAAEFDTAPYKVEALAAFDLTKSTDGNSSSGNHSGSAYASATPFDASNICGMCDGKGKVSCMRCSDGKIDCQECGGDGWVNISLEDEMLCPKCHGATKVDCPSCNGSGEKTCTFCGGDGKR